MLAGFRFLTVTSTGICPQYVSFFERRTTPCFENGSGISSKNHGVTINDNFLNSNARSSDGALATCGVRVSQINHA